MLCFHPHSSNAAFVCGAAKVVALGTLLWVTACGGRPESETTKAPQNVRVYESFARESIAGRCAWYGVRRKERLLFGISAFWSEPDATRSLARREAPEIGHFDLAQERFLPRQTLGEAPMASGIWDLAFTENGALFFTSLGGRPGYVGPSDKSKRLDAVGSGSNEAIALPGGGVAYSDYDSRRITILSADFAPERHIDLSSNDEWDVAPKSIAYNPRTEKLWVTTDLLDRQGEAHPKHDARSHDFASGREIDRIEDPEIQMLAFAPDGSGYFVFVEKDALWLERHDAGGDSTFGEGERILLDGDFARDLDFAQDLAIEADGRVVVTRWSGAIHVLERDATLRTARLPRPPPTGLFYSAALRGDRVCATYCSRVRVVCGDLP